MNSFAEKNEAQVGRRTGVRGKGDGGVVGDLWMRSKYIDDKLTGLIKWLKSSRYPSSLVQTNAGQIGPLSSLQNLSYRDFPVQFVYKLCMYEH